jgi:hypothetical protein
MQSVIFYKIPFNVINNFNPNSVIAIFIVHGLFLLSRKICEKERTAANGSVVLYKPLPCFKTEAGGINKKDPATVFKTDCQALVLDTPRQGYCNK